MTIIICRCEDVSLERVEEVIGQGKTTLNDVKRHTRVGMGRCQGVYCHSEVRHLLGETPLDPMTARPPARQITLEGLADLIAETGDD